MVDIEEQDDNLIRKQSQIVLTQRALVATCLLIVASLFGLNLYVSFLVSEQTGQIERNTERVIQCTTPGTECTSRGERNLEGAMRILQLNHNETRTVIMLTEICSQQGNSTLDELEQCVEKTKKEAEKNG